MSSVPIFEPFATRAQKTKLAVAIAGSIMASSMPSTAFSQQLEEVIVTATKRAESVQDVPLAITAFSGDFTRNVNLNDVKDLVAFTPGITGNSQDSFIDAISIRGIRTQDFGIGGDPSAAFFKNDLYEGRTGAAVSSLYDMERSEVLRGPQGFLFGRNSIGGAISVHTGKAEIDGGNAGYIDIDVAQFGRIAVEGAVNLPVNDSLAFRVAGYHSEEDGDIQNEFDGKDLTYHDKSALRLPMRLKNYQYKHLLNMKTEIKQVLIIAPFRKVQVGKRWKPTSVTLIFEAVNMALIQTKLQAAQTKAKF
ncbi:MAG: iron complex outermembrane receptor protein [Flavobacteriales bacterium]|jgi:iron complex outermembrane receptor protein